MTQFRIAVLIGSLRQESYNRRLAEAVRRLAPRNFSFHDSRIDDLPLYNQDNDADPPEPVRRLRNEIRSAEGILFVTPEYNRSVPGVLKNAIDHASRPYGQNAWKGKPAGIIGASVGAPGTSMAQQHLRNMLAYLDVPALGQPEVFIQVSDGFFDENGIASADTRRFLQGWMNKFTEWVKGFAERPVNV
jgi:chromate reductase, NAD(P)H dehydrogenase (quinone)